MIPAIKSPVTFHSTSYLNPNLPSSVFPHPRELPAPRPCTRTPGEPPNPPASTTSSGEARTPRALSPHPFAFLLFCASFDTLSRLFSPADRRGHRRPPPPPADVNSGEGLTKHRSSPAPPTSPPGLLRLPARFGNEIPFPLPLLLPERMSPPVAGHGATTSRTTGDLAPHG